VRRISFFRTSAVFLRLKGYAGPKARKVKARVGRPSEFPKARSFAYFDPNTFEIVVAPKIEKQPWDRIEALLAHEFGHAVLCAYGMMDHTEREADEMAARIVGKRVRYDLDDVQSLKRGVRVRPARLK
jgi:hypothetical protein